MTSPIGNRLIRGKFLRQLGHRRANVSEIGHTPMLTLSPEVP
jgi:hypothetical protein